MSSAPPTPVTSDMIPGLAASTALDINTSFLLQSGYLVFFMHCGFAMLSIGCVRARFAKHIAILILVDACVSALGFFFFGYAFGFGDPKDQTPAGAASGGAPGLTTTGGNPFVGTQFFGLHDMTPYLFASWLFQWSFAATACTIVSGAIAERAKFEAYICYSFFMASWVYPVIVHSAWTNTGVFSMTRSQPPNLLFNSGAIDFAGSGAVHMVGGLAALSGCFILGPRIGRYNADGSANNMPGHNTSLFVLGVLILWFGWYGFNPGSQQGITNGQSQAVATAAIATTIAAGSGGFSALITRAIVSKVTTGVMVYDVMVMGNGVLAGLVAITAPCAVVWPWAAIIIGAIAGIIYTFASMVSIMARLDDPLDAIAVHAWNGLWGVWSVGFFASRELVFNSYGTSPQVGTFPGDIRPYGCFLGGGGLLLASQVVYSLWIIGWVLGNMVPFWLILNAMGHFRVPANVETIGLDDSYHGGSAYPGGPEEMSDSSLRGAAAAKQANGGGMAGGGMAGGGASRAEIDEIKAELAMLKSSVKAHSVA